MITDPLPTVYRLASPDYHENCHTCLVKMPPTDSFLAEITKDKGNRQYISAGTSGNLPNAPLWKGLPHTAYVMLLLKEDAPKDAEPIIKREEPGQLPREELNRKQFEILGHTVVMLNEWNNAIITKYVIYTATDTASDNIFNKPCKRIGDGTQRKLALDYQKKLAADLLNLNENIFYALLYPLPYAGHRIIAKELITKNPIPHIKSHLEAEILAKQKDTVFENEKKAVKDLLNEFCERQKYSDEQKEEFFKLFLLDCYLRETSLYTSWIKSLTQSPYSGKFFDYLLSTSYIPLKHTFMGGYGTTLSHHVLGISITQFLSTAINDDIFISLVEKWKSIDLSELDELQQVSLAGWLFFEYRSMPDFINLLITPDDNKAKYTKKIGMIREFANSFYYAFSIPLPENLINLVQNDILKKSNKSDEVYSLVCIFKSVAKLIGFQLFHKWLEDDNKLNMMIELSKCEQAGDLLESLVKANFTTDINEKKINQIFTLKNHISEIAPNIIILFAKLTGRQFFRKWLVDNEKLEVMINFSQYESITRNLLASLLELKLSPFLNEKIIHLMYISNIYNARLNSYDLNPFKVAVIELHQFHSLPNDSELKNTESFIKKNNASWLEMKQLPKYFPAQLINNLNVLAKLIGLPSLRKWLTDDEKLEMIFNFSRYQNESRELLESLNRFDFTSDAKEKIIDLILKLDIYTFTITSPDNTIIELHQLALGLNNNPEAKDIDLYAEGLRSAWNKLVYENASRDFYPNSINIILYLINARLIKIATPPPNSHFLFSAHHTNRQYHRYHANRDIRYKNFLFNQKYLPMLGEIIFRWHEEGQERPKEIDMLYELIKITSKMPADLDKPVLFCELLPSFIAKSKKPVGEPKLAQEEWELKSEKQEEGNFKLAQKEWEFKLARLIDLKKHCTYLKENNIKITAGIIRTILNASESELRVLKAPYAAQEDLEYFSPRRAPR